MPKTKISEFSSTPANNTDIDSINIAEGCAPSGINDAIRELMAQLKDWQSGTSNDPMVIGSSGSLTLNQGTANGVAYLNGSKVVTSGSALTFDGTNFATTGNIRSSGANGNIGATGTTGNATLALQTNARLWTIGTSNSDSALYWRDETASAELMRLTSTGLGIGTSSPAYKLQVIGASNFQVNAAGTQQVLQLNNSDTTAGTQAVKLGFSSSGTTKASINAAVYGNDYMTFNVGSDTERMRIDASGNLGLGVTPSAWWSSTKAIQVGAGGVISGRTDTAARNYFASNAYLNSTPAWTYISTNFATRYEQNDGQHQWFTAASGTAGNAITFTQAMTLDASGRLGIGTTSPSSKLDISGGAATTTIRVSQTAAGSASEVRFGDDVSTDGGLIIKGGSSFGSYGGANSFMFWNNRSGPVVFGTNDTERARIDSSGNLLVGTTAVSTSNLNGTAVRLYGGGSYLEVAHNNTATSGQDYAAFRYNGTQIGGITQSGTTAVAYNTSSDYRLKHDIAPMTGALAKVVALKPVTYKWNADGSDGEGFIAHELAEVCPHAVTGEKDAVDENGNPKYQGIDTSFLVATLTAAIQELKAEFDAYKASHP